MSWNDQLYIYTQKRGGTYLGRMEEKHALTDESYMQHGGMALLMHKGAPLLIKSWCDMDRYSIQRGVQVQLNCELERPYFFSVTPKNILRKGLNFIMTGKEKEYGFPELTAGRGIKTDNKEFTKAVLRDLELRNALMKNTDYGLDIEPNVPKCVGGGSQCITAWCRLDSGMAGSIAPEWGILDTDGVYTNPEQLDSPAFTRKLDDLVALAKIAHDALVTWRMPVE